MIHVLLALAAAAGAPSETTPAPIPIIVRAAQRLSRYEDPPFVYQAVTVKEGLSNAADSRVQITATSQYRIQTRSSDHAWRVQRFFPVPKTPQPIVGFTAWFPPDAWVSHQRFDGISQRVQLPDVASLQNASAIDRDYAVHLAGVERNATGAVYDIALSPKSDPALHNIRELWIDEDGDIIRAALAGQYMAINGFEAFPATVTQELSRVDGTLLITSESWTYRPYGTGLWRHTSAVATMTDLPALLQPQNFQQPGY